jgi:hypothetical protein
MSDRALGVPGARRPEIVTMAFASLDRRGCCSPPAGVPSTRKWNTMHRSLFRIITLSGLVFLSACAKVPTSDIKTRAAVDDTVKFSGFETYSWFAGLGLVKDDTGRWDNGELDVSAELKFIIDKSMRERGLNESSAHPDLLVGFLIVADLNQLQEVSERGGKVSSIEGVGKSALIIELIDARTNHTVWLGAAAGDAKTGRSSAELKERLDYAVTALFRDLPRD